jgi:hypothetical protein
MTRFALALALAAAATAVPVAPTEGALLEKQRAAAEAPSAPTTTSATANTAIVQIYPDVPAAADGLTGVTRSHASASASLSSGPPAPAPAPFSLRACTCCPFATDSPCNRVEPVWRGMGPRRNGPRRVVVTPAGRRRYIRLLFAHLACQVDEFDLWQVWVNTNVLTDLAWFRGVAAAYPWVELVELPGGVTSVSNLNINRFFPSAADPEALYLRLDDDVVWLEPGFVRTMFEYREAHPGPFLVFANIINNAILSHIHYRNGRVAYPAKPGYACMDAVGWRDPIFAQAVHEAFLPDAERGNVTAWKASFAEWHCTWYERVSINAVAWRGDAMAAALPVVGDEEQYLSVVRPKNIQAPNVIIGGAVCAHFAFFPQREHMDRTGILARYEALAGLVE